jgi:hypothetical protein
MMKRILWLLFSFLMPIALMAQGNNIAYSDIENYREDTVSSQFQIRFDTQEELQSFKHLREFRREREDLLSALRTELMYYQDERKYIKLYQNHLHFLNSEKSRGRDSVEVAAAIVSDYGFAMHGLDQARFETYRRKGGDAWTQPYNFPVAMIDELIGGFEIVLKDLENETKINQNLNKNISIASQDLEFCERALDFALAPEYKAQSFKTSISIMFTILIGILLISVFGIVAYRSDQNIATILLSGTGLQFITLFVLIIAIILFGILGILESSELAALLAGISGYILGKGVPGLPKASPTPEEVPNATENTQPAPKEKAREDKSTEDTDNSTENAKVGEVIQPASGDATTTE